MPFFNNHTHTCYSNIRLVDSTNRPVPLIKKAIEMGMSGIAITDHEALCSHVTVNKFAKELRKTNPNFTVALGNEIYLTETRDKGQKYYHFILIAKDEVGYRALKELSSIAWINSYYDRGLERVPLLKSELLKVMKDYKGHIIATTACIGGELGQLVLKMNAAEQAPGAEKQAKEFHQRIVKFLEFCIDVFGRDDFYIECAPSSYPEQVMVNKRILEIAQAFGLKMCIGTDAHYYTTEDRYVHKSYLNSKEGDREVDAFYEFARLMEEDEVIELLSLAYDMETINWIFDCSEIMRQGIEFFDLYRPQSIVEVPVKDYPKSAWWGTNNDQADEMSKYPTLKSLFTSDNIQERYWVNQCWESMKEKNLLDSPKYDYVGRLEEEARVKRIIGEKLGTCMFAYPNTLQHYIDLFWNCGSIVGAGRGSACAGLNHYLLGITQLDPLEWDLPWWRYMNDERVELGDIDLDLAPSKIQTIFKAIREERGELGLIQVATFGTEGTKSTILTACRGYRSEEYPDGIDNDTAQYISSLVPSERGFLWPLKDLLEGNEEKGRKPSKTFINAVNQYPRLLEIMKSIEGLVNKRSSHASGVILFDENIYDTAAVMKTPTGSLITQWDLHDTEYTGNTKYDFLLTSVQDIIIQTIELLQEDGMIEKDLSLREVYNKYLHPSVLPQDDPKMWDALGNGEVLGCFQFDSPDGGKAARKIKPRNPIEMSDANGLMRLMPAKGEEAPIDKYVRFKNDISLWYKEMNEHGLTKQEQKILEPYFLPSYGVPPSQEAMMKILQDPGICGFTLSEANTARKIVGKKQMNKIPELREKVLKQAKSENLGEYVWTYALGPQMGYSFSLIHALAYSFIGMQTLYLATHFNPVYWNTAFLIVNSGAISQEEGDQSDYAKIAKAIGEIRGAGIKVSLVDINHSGFGFKPDVENNQILFGLKGMVNMGDDVIRSIIDNRPYVSMVDFYNRVNPNKQAMIALIKGGAFDNFGKSRMRTMAEYIWLTCDKKKRITLQNMPGLMKYGLIPQTEEFYLPKRVFEFNRYLKANCRKGISYALDNRAIDFLNEIDQDRLYDDNFLMDTKAWDKVYQGYMDIFRGWITENKESILDDLNMTIFKEDWNKYASGNISSWEMEALCFYYHDHELINVNMEKYGLKNFSDLPEEPVIDKFVGKAQIPIYRLCKICGTCIAKNKTKSTVYLLTTDGVAAVKFRGEHFALFDKQISEKGSDGKKHVIEKSWFNRGQMILVQGYRRGQEFVAKKYTSQGGHQLYHIDEITENGNLILRSERKQGEQEDEE